MERGDVSFLCMRWDWMKSEEGGEERGTHLLSSGLSGGHDGRVELFGSECEQELEPSVSTFPRKEGKRVGEGRKGGGNAPVLHVLVNPRRLSLSLNDSLVLLLNHHGHVVEQLCQLG